MNYIQGVFNDQNYNILISGYQKNGVYIGNNTDDHITSNPGIHLYHDLDLDARSG